MIVELRILVAIVLIGLIIWLYIIFQDKKFSSSVSRTKKSTVALPGLESLQFTHPMALRLQEHLEKVVIGQRALVNGLIVSLLAGKHVLVQSLPGMAKTTAIKTLAWITGLSFGRVQGTPDLLPSDIVGLEVLDSANHTHLKQWPIFANIILFDEVNRTTPKVQSALMECMEERQVTIGHQTVSLPNPFVVFATANPIGSRGVYDLPEAQLDRFAMSVVLDYPDNEKDILRQSKEQVQFHWDNDIMIGFQTISDGIDTVTVDDMCIDMISWIIQKTRQMPDVIIVGCSPRASKDLLYLAKAVAYLSWKTAVDKAHILLLMDSVLTHRIVWKKDADSKSVLRDISQTT